MAQTLKTDKILFTTVVLMVLFGAVMIYSASSVVADIKKGSSYFYAIRQIIWIVAAIPLMMWLKTLNYRKLNTPAVAFTAMSIVVMLLVIVYFADAKQHRWIRIPGVGQLQPSEFAKPALALFLAYFLALRSKAINSKATLMPVAMALLVVTVGVVLADLGTALVLIGMAAIVLLAAGLKLKYVGWSLVFVFVLGVGAIAVKPYRLARVVSKLDPKFTYIDKYDRAGWVRGQIAKTITAQDTEYQPKQARIAVGSGGLMGLGLMQGRQKLFYLPEAHTDTIFAVVGEEFGLLGCTAVLIGFVVILWRGTHAAVFIPDDFGRYLALGITSALVIQAFFNMTVIVGIFPTKGIPLPMISFGGSSLMVTLASLGVLLNISEHAG